jgi:hypothetical protein
MAEGVTAILIIDHHTPMVFAVILNKLPPASPDPGPFWMLGSRPAACASIYDVCVVGLYDR